MRLHVLCAVRVDLRDALQEPRIFRRRFERRDEPQRLTCAPRLEQRPDLRYGLRTDTTP